MNASEFHRLLRTALGPAFQAAGFTAAKGGIARWSWNEAGRSVRVSFGPNRWGWSDPWGSDFRIEVRESIDGEDAGRFNILEFFDVHDVREFCRLRNAVVDKGLARIPRDAVAGVTSHVQREVRELEKADSPMPYTETVFPWIDADDLAQWASFLAPLAGRLLPRLDALATLDPAVRRRALHDCWKQSDLRSDDEKAAHRALMSAALARSNAALGALGEALTPSPGYQGEP